VIGLLGSGLPRRLRVRAGGCLDPADIGPGPALCRETANQRRKLANGSASATHPCAVASPKRTRELQQDNQRLRTASPKRWQQSAIPPAGRAAIKPAPRGTTSEPGSPTTPRLPRQLDK
jgi:hypothetical protein